MTNVRKARWAAVAITIMLIAWTVPATGEWTQWRGSADHDAHAETPGAVKTPRIGWSFNLSNQYPIASPTVGDVNGETLVLLGGYTTPTGGTTQGSVYALTPDGGIAWEARPSLGNLGGFGATPAFIEDDDGIGVIAGQAEASEWYRFDATDGTLETSFSMGSSDQDLIVGSPTVGDATGDGSPEILLPGSQQGHDGTFFILSSDLDDVLFEHELNAPAWSSPLLADVTGDGTDEAIVSTGVPDAACFIFGTLHPTANPKTGDDEGRVYVFEHDEDDGWSLLWETLLDGPTMSSPVVADLDGDGANEIVVGNQDERGSCTDPTNLQMDAFLTVLDDQGTVQDTRPGPLPLSITTPLITDLTGDGELEIVHGDWTGLQALSYDGQTLQPTRSYAIQDDRHDHDHWVIASPAAADINADGTPNIVALSIPIDINQQNPLNSETKPGMLVAVEPTADSFALTWQHPTPTDGGLSGPTLADVTGNGYSEIIFGMGLPIIGDSNEARMLEPANPIVDTITHNPSTPKTLQEVTFHADVLYPAGDPATLTYAWDFDDEGQTSTEPSPSHAFTGHGTYDVTLTVTDKDDDAWTQTHTLNVDPLEPAPAFTYTPAVPDANDPITFTDESTHPDPDLTITNWHWAFDDGTTSTQQHPTHAYEDPGVYAPTLTVTDEQGQQATQTHIIRVNAPPNAAFTHDTQHPQPRILDPIQFTDQSTDPDGTITTWHWDFDDGTTSTQQHPTHTYEEPDTYNVTLTVTDNNDTTAQTKTSLTVENWPPTAGFTHTPHVPDPHQAITFTDESTHPQAPTIDVTNWHWAFGDGNTSTQQHPTHTYTQQGTHEVTLTVTDTEGKTDTHTAPVHVGIQPPNPAFNPDPPNPRIEDEIRFTDATTHPEDDVSLETWYWDFGDGNTSTTRHPTHAYTTIGDKTITLTVTDSNGLSNTHTETLTVAPHAKAHTSAHPANVDRPVTLDATPSQAPGGTITSYEWTLDDTLLSTEPTLEHTFQEPGEPCLTLRIETATGLTDQTPVCILVQNTLTPKLSLTDDTYDATEKAKGFLKVQYANGDHVPHALFTVTVTYQTGNDALDAYLAQDPCFTWSTTSLTGPTGLASFTVPPLLERCGAPIDLVEAPGQYEANVQTAWGPNHGTATTTYQTTPLG